VLLVPGLLRGPADPSKLWIVGLMVLCPVVVVLTYVSTEGFRIGGDRGEVRFFADRLEVPGRTVRQPMAFGREGVSIGVVRQQVRIVFFGVPGGTVERGSLFTFREGTECRRLSSLTFENPDWVSGFREDLALWKAGRPPLGPRTLADMQRQEDRADPARARYEAELDRQLDELGH
jgi:hypothetical protein